MAELERTGNIVYPVNVIQMFIAGGHADSANADAIINMAHGRMGDNVVGFLEKAIFRCFLLLTSTATITNGWPTSRG